MTLPELQPIVSVLKKAVFAAFITLLVMLSYFNCIRTENALMDVEDFFVRTRTVQAAQVAADRAMVLAEQRSYEYADLKEAFKVLAKDSQRLAFECEDVTIKASMYEQVIHGQNVYIVQLQDLLKQNQLPVPAQPPLNLRPPTCPSPNAGNSFNSQRPTTPPKPEYHNSEAGLSPRNSTEPDAFGTVGSVAA